MRFGRLVVLDKAEKTKDGHSKWRCRCDCGKDTIVIGINLTSGRTSSCGCLRNEKTTERLSIHKGYNTPTYKTWANMIQRCTNNKNKDFEHYGGRGITVYTEWRKDFSAFFAYVSQLPHFSEDGYSLDRINNDGNYEPGNVRWATRIEQNNNRRPYKAARKE